MFKNIIFDWSGVINDNSFAIYQTVREVLLTKGTQLNLTFDEFRKRWKQPYMDFYHQFLPDFSLEEQCVLYQKILPKYEENKVVLGMNDLIKNDFNKDINLFVISSDYPETLLKQVKLFELENLFKEIICGSHDKSNDVKALIEKYKLDLDKTIFIGDSNHEIDSARKNGIKSCAVTWGLSDANYLASFNPDFIAYNPKELKHILFNIC